MKVSMYKVSESFPRLSSGHHTYTRSYNTDSDGTKTNRWSTNDYDAGTYSKASGRSPLKYLRKIKALGLSAYGVVGKVGFLIGGTILGFSSQYIFGHCPSCGNTWFSPNKQESEALVCCSMNNINTTLSELNTTFLKLVDLRNDITAIASQQKDKRELREELEMIKFGIRQAFPNVATNMAANTDKLKISKMAASQDGSIHDSCLRLDQEGLRETNASVANLTIDQLSKGSINDSESKGLLGNKC